MFAFSTLAGLVIGLFFFPATGAVAGTENGRAHISVELGKKKLDVFTYRPRHCLHLDLILVFHGLGRDAEDYRDGAEPLADRLCMFVVAPLFEAKLFPRWQYQRGGVMHERQPVPRDEWTVALVARLVTWARKRENLADARLYLFGHSAGGQFLSRVAAYAPPPGAERIVIANPSSHVAPTLTEMAPYGFAGLFDDMAAEKALRQYLQLPITIYLGTADTGQHHLLMNNDARQQGETRLERGRTIYRMAVTEARAHGWPCNWKLVEAQGVGHSVQRMLAVPEVLAAFGRKPGEPMR